MLMLIGEVASSDGLGGTRTLHKIPGGDGIDKVLRLEQDKYMHAIFENPWMCMGRLYFRYSIGRKTI